MHNYCAASRPHVLKAVKNLDMIAEGIVRDGLSFHGMPTAEFFQDKSNHVARCLKSGVEASSRVPEAVSMPSVGTRRLQESTEAACNSPSQQQSDGRPEDDSANAETQSSAMCDIASNFPRTIQSHPDKAGTALSRTALEKQDVAPGWSAQCGEIELTTMPTSSTQWTPSWSNTVPSCNVRGEAEPNPALNTGSTWPATELEALPTLSMGNWNPLCGEVELSAMPDTDHLWPFEGREPVSMSNDDWSALCGEVEITTMRNAHVPWAGSLGAEGFAVLPSGGNHINEGDVTSGQALSHRNGST